MKVYEQNQTASGLFFNKKLRREHVHLNSYSRMRVNLAAQVGLDIACLIYLTVLIFINFRFSVHPWPMLWTITEIRILQRLGNL